MSFDLASLTSVGLASVLIWLLPFYFLASVCSFFALLVFALVEAFTFLSPVLRLSFTTDLVLALPSVFLFCLAFALILSLVDLLVAAALLGVLPLLGFYAGFLAFIAFFT